MYVLTWKLVVGDAVHSPLKACLTDLAAAAAKKKRAAADQAADGMAAITIATTTTTTPTTPPTTTPTTTADVAAVFGKYQAVGEISKAIGAVGAGAVVSRMQAAGATELESLQAPVYFFAMCSLLKLLLYSMLSEAVEVDSAMSGAGLPRSTPKTAAAAASAASAGTAATKGGKFALVCLPDFGLQHPSSKVIVLRLSTLFSVDAFAGGFVMQTFLSFWFAERWGLEVSFKTPTPEHHTRAHTHARTVH